MNITLIALSAFSMSTIGLLKRPVAHLVNCLTLGEKVMVVGFGISYFILRFM